MIFRINLKLFYLHVCLRKGKALTLWPSLLIYSPPSCTPSPSILNERYHQANIVVSPKSQFEEKQNEYYGIKMHAYLMVVVVIQLVALGNVKRSLSLRSTDEPPGFRVAERGSRGHSCGRGRFVLPMWD